MSYDKQTWAAGQVGGTPLSPLRLNHMEDGIKDADVRVTAVEEALADVLAGAPGALDTFLELATQLQADESGAAALTTALTNEITNRAAGDAARVLKSGDSMTGDLAMSGNRVTGLADPAAAQDAATRAYVLMQIAALVNSAPALLDTIGELAAALQSDESAAAALTALVALKAPLASPAFTGTPTKSGSPLLTQSDANAAYRSVNNNTLGVIGTSISNRNLETAGIRQDAGSSGYLTWARMELLCPFRLVVNDGQSGTTAADMASRFATTVAPYTPGWVIFEPGPNDIQQTPAITPATLEASILSVVQQAEAMNAEVLFLCAIAPANAWTTAQKNTMAKVNNWMRRLCTLRQSKTRLVYVDWYSAVVDPTTDAWYATCSTDGTHPNTKGARRMGKVLADAMRAIGYPQISRLPQVASTIDLDLITANPRFTGTGGAVGTGQTGTTPTSWTTLRSPSGEAATWTTSQVARSTIDTTSVIDGNLLKIDPTGGTGGRGLVIFQLVNVGSKFAAADGFLYDALCEFYLDAAYAAITKLELKVEFQDSGGNALAQSYSSFLGSSVGNWPTEQKILHGVLEAPPITPPATTAKVFVGLYYDGDAPIYLDRTGMRRVLDLTAA